MATLFFDFDGTVADSEAGIVAGLKYMVQDRGLRPLDNSAYVQFIGPALVDMLPKVWPELDDVEVKRAIDAFHHYYEEEGLYQAKLYPKFLDTMTELKQQGDQLYIASAKPETMLHRLVKHFSLDQYFAGAYGASDDEQTRVTKTDVLAYALKATQTDPAVSVMIGDRANDMTGGLDNHVQLLGVTYGFGSAKELQDAGAKVLANKPEAIPEGLKKVAKLSAKS
ncbi:HAD hydrolase-like protein [Lacticaseibacillus casei]|jgi:phosphoglycolate phosphatase|uniref:HAD hydrolase-like protein n=1 Tax=Lacticaseibacillus huelsenbergensis TaxID=3035291 RepID=A0ABY8DMX9_9LACO|nr:MULTISPECIES: HAD hydrolase-like protein [Lacticaseibacillus]MDG3062562.1 HAD hydrolase-like protein [Lacticaseibacillus sp. BCRC 81376]QVI38375.1 HAD hydrolase-like protein [Lacticaseibacillus casei]QXG60188.1 HAD hydrolase-like protein [Lacticaseibacillus casei]WFB38336.1 HAD hydrolase-like protein [Lacticaseibacillus huelsenbergensis]WFB42760.1 HAD hydrolase-like protein [Lacticaseibacillus huelsenbergensis]